MLRLINKSLLSFFVLTLTACATLPAQDSAFTNKMEQMGIKAPEAKLITSSDLLRLENFFSSGAPEAQLSWRNEKTKIKFRVISQTIFLNDNGEICRHYELSMQSTFRDRHLPSQTVCRENGQWVNYQKIYPDKENS
jgi:hypothetical protein